MKFAADVSQIAVEPDLDQKCRAVGNIGIGTDKTECYLTPNGFVYDGVISILLIILLKWPIVPRPSVFVILCV